MNEPVDLLRLPNLHAIETYEEDGALIIKVRAKQPSVGCCLLPRRVKNGVKTFRCRDFAIQNQAVWVEVDRQRYRCSSCGDSPYERFEDLDPDRNLTVRFRKYVEEQVIEHTFAAAARNEAIGNAISNPTHVEESYNNSVVFVDAKSTNGSGDPFRVPVKIIQGTSSGRVKSFYFASSSSSKIIWGKP